MHSKNYFTILILVVLALSIFVAGVNGLIVLNNPVYLSYNNGSSVMLPAGTYFSLFRNSTENLWYVNGAVYPPIPTPSPTPNPNGSTPTPTPSPTAIPTLTPIPTTPPLTPSITPSPTPVIIPNNREKITYSLYFRPDTYTTLGVSGYGLDTDYTNNYQTIPITATGNVNITYGFRVFLLTSAIRTTELTSGTPAGLITLGSNFTGQVSSVWNCPQQTVILGYQAIRIDLYTTIDNGATWTAQAGFISNVLMTTQIEPSTWGFTLNVNMIQTDNTVCSVSFGDTNNRCTVSNIVTDKALESELQAWRLSRNDYIGFELGAYMDLIGTAFYVLILLIPTGILYFRYGHVGTIVFFFVLFGGAGGLVWILVPAWAAAPLSALLILAFSFVVWRIIR